MAPSPGLRKRTRRTKRTTGHNATLGQLASDLPAATFTTLAYRIPMLFTAPFTGGAREDPELLRMVVEKAEAAHESAGAIGDGWWALMATLQRTSRHQQKVFNAVAEAIGDSNPPAALRRLHRQGQLSAELVSELTAAIGEIGSRTAVRSLRPAHRRVVANAKRLSKSTDKR